MHINKLLRPCGANNSNCKDTKKNSFISDKSPSLTKRPFSARQPYPTSHKRNHRSPQWHH